jgi:hypothetical protein
MPRNLLILAQQAPPLTAHLTLPVSAYLEPTRVLWDRRARAPQGDPPPLRRNVVVEPRLRDRRAPEAGQVTHGVTEGLSS